MSRPVAGDAPPVPDALASLVRGCRGIGPDDVPARRAGGEADARRAAVLVLFGLPDAGPDLLLLERAADLRAHAGQAAFPGGGLEDADGGPVDAALREAAEETGLDPAGVTPLVTLPPLTIPVSGFSVTPVVAHWRRPSAVRAVDAGETARVVRVPVADLADPARRFTVVSPSGYVGPAFAVGGLLVWGFTALLVDWLLELGGWARPWDTEDLRDLDKAWARRRRPPSPGGGDAEGGTDDETDCGGTTR